MFQKFLAGRKVDFIFMGGAAEGRILCLHLPLEVKFSDGRSMSYFLFAGVFN